MLPPPPALRPLRIEKSPARLSLGSSPLSPISPSPFRPSNDSPVKTPDKKSPKKTPTGVHEIVVVNGRGRRKVRQKRRIGRPPKNREPSPDNSVSPPREVKRKKPGRKPGRPPNKDKGKVDRPAHKVDQPARKVGRPAKRRPGRPKKVVENETDDNPSKTGIGKGKTLKVPGRRPGRPRKNAPKVIPEEAQKDTDVSRAESEEEEVSKAKTERTVIDTEEATKHEHYENPPTADHLARVSPVLKKKMPEDNADSSSSNDSSDSSNSDTSDSDDDEDGNDNDNDEEDDNDGDNDDSEEEDETSKTDIGIPKESFGNSLQELKTKVRRLSISSSEDSDVLPRKSDVTSSKNANHSQSKKSDEDSGDNQKPNSTVTSNKMFSDSDSDSEDEPALKRLEKEGSLGKEDDAIGLPLQPREEDEDDEDNIASQNLAVLVKEYDAEVKKPEEVTDPERPPSVQSDDAQESASFGTVDELSDNLSDPPTPSDPQIPSSPPPAPAPVYVPSDDDEMPSPTGSMGRGPTPTPPHLTQSEQPMGRKSADPMLSSPPRQQPVQQQSQQQQQIGSQSSSLQQQQSVMASPNSGSNTTTPQSKPSMPVIVPPSPVMVSASPGGEIKQHPLTPSNQQMPTPSSVKSHEDTGSYQSVGSNQGQQTMPSPAATQLTSPAHLTSPGQYQHTSPAQQPPPPPQMTSPGHHQQLTSPGHYQPLTSPGQQQPLTSPAHLHSPAQMISQHQHQQPDKHLSPMASSPSMPQQQQQKSLAGQPTASAQVRTPVKGPGSRAQGRSRSASASQSRNMPPNFPAPPSGGPPPLSSINSLQQQTFDLNVSQLGGLGSPASMSSSSGSNDMSTDTSQQHPMSNLYDCAQNMQYCNNNLQGRNSFMDTVNISNLQAQQQQPAYMGPSTTSLVQPPHASPLSIYSPSMLPPPSQAHQPQHQRQHPRQQPQSSQQPLHHQQQNSPRLVHSSVSLPTVVQQAMLQGGGVGLYQHGQQANNPELLKLQQLTNRFPDLPPESLHQMTPPQNMTPPPPSAAVNMTPPPSMMRPVAAAPIHSTLPGTIPTHLALMGQPTAPPYKRQRSSSSASSRKTSSVPPPPISSNSNSVTLNPGNMGGLSPNVTIQPGSAGAAGMFPRYLNYRLPQGMIQPGYITNSHGFLQPQQIPMQMQMMNMNMHPGGPGAASQAAAFQPQVQPGQPTNPAVFPQYYINANNVMRR